jgi:hypothetical protein
MQENTANKKIIYMDVPEDKDILVGVGVLTIRNSQLDYALRMTIKSLANLSIEEALDATARVGSQELRKRINKLATQRLGEGPSLLKLQAILKRAGTATDKRNIYVHSLWAQELDGSAVIRNDDHSWEAVPSAQELEKLANNIHAITQELNTARLHGFLSEALSNKP